MKVLLTGASGFIGSHLIQAMLKLDYELVAVSRNPESVRDKFPEQVQLIGWEGPDLLSALKSSGAVINLAGESISGFPWTKIRKRAIMNSRVLAAQRLHHALSVLGNWNGVFIQSSAVGYYGSKGENECSEQCDPGKGFLAKVCSKWESRITEIQALSKRVVAVRIGVVLGRDGGIFPQLSRQSRWHIAGKLGNGEQWLSWIHIYDLVYGILYLLNDDNASGVFNLSAPNPVKQKTFSAMMREIGGTGYQFPAPAIMIRLLLGEFGRELLLSGQKVSTGKLIRQGFVFGFPDLRQALNDLFDPYEP